MSVETLTGAGCEGEKVREAVGQARAVVQALMMPAMSLSTPAMGLQSFI